MHTILLLFFYYYFVFFFLLTTMELHGAIIDIVARYVFAHLAEIWHNCRRVLLLYYVIDTYRDIDVLICGYGGLDWWRQKEIDKNILYFFSPRVNQMLCGSIPPGSNRNRWIRDTVLRNIEPHKTHNVQNSWIPNEPSETTATSHGSFEYAKRICLYLAHVITVFLYYRRFFFVWRILALRICPHENIS